MHCRRTGAAILVALIAGTTCAAAPTDDEDSQRGPGAASANGAASLEVTDADTARHPGQPDVQSGVDSAAIAAGAGSGIAPIAENESRPLGPLPSAEDPGDTSTDDPAATDSAGRTAFDLEEWGRIGGALAVVLVAIFLLRLVFRRIAGPLAGRSRPSGVVEVLARYPIARGQSVVLMRLARRVLVLHQSSGSLTPLSEISDPDEVASLLSRLESGSRLQDAVRFRRTLESYREDHDRADAQGDDTGSAPWPATQGAEIEVIDLTRAKPRRIAGRKTS